MEQEQMKLFQSGKVSVAVLKNAIPAMIAMLMELIYNLADTFFIEQTHDDLQVAAVSMCTPVFLLFLAEGTVFGMGGVSVISRAIGAGETQYARKVSSFCMWSGVGVGVVMALLFWAFMDPLLHLIVRLVQPENMLSPIRPSCNAGNSTYSRLVQPENM